MDHAGIDISGISERLMGTALVRKPTPSPGVHSAPPKDVLGDTNVLTSLLS